MFGDSYRDFFSAVAFLRTRVTYSRGKIKTEVKSICFGESARGANESNDCPKAGFASSSNCWSAEERIYLGTYGNC